MKKKKITNRIFGFIFVTLFITYVTLYFANTNGYYQYRKQVNLTNEQIIMFEKDIKEGKDVTINDYLKNQSIKYDNNTSKLGYNVSKTVSNILNDGIKSMFKFLNEFVEE